VRLLGGEPIDWQANYTDVLQRGVEVFRAFVLAWYQGDLEKIFFAKRQDPEIKKQICSVLAGYVWDVKNPFVVNHTASISRLKRLVNHL
jgi:hypothetical protein